MTQAKRFCFIVQGEGRGHLTQAIALSEFLLSNGHQLWKVYVGVSGQRLIPDYFHKDIGAPVRPFISPNFYRDKENKAILIWKSIWVNLKNCPTFLMDINAVNREITQDKPDFIVNFYEPLFGFSQLFSRNQIPLICIAHQYIYLHPTYKMDKGSMFDRLSLLVLTYISQLRSKRNLAISFYPIKTASQAKGKLMLIPPILRKEIYHLKPTDNQFLLTYILNTGYATDIESWARKNPEVKIEVFWDNLESENPWQCLPNLIFHHLDGKLFMEKMASCSGVITTAGFETLCESIVLSKKIVVIPVEGHFEQYLNSFDALKTGLADRCDLFQFDEITAKMFQMETDSTVMDEIKTWVKSGFENVINSAIAD